MKPTWIAVVAAVALAFAGADSWADDEQLEFESELTGAQEVTTPPGGVVTPASGTCDVEFDEGLTKVRVRLRVRDTIGDVTRGHFHCGRPGQNGPIAFGLFDPGPCDFDSGRLSCTLTNADLTDVNNNCGAATNVGRPVSNIAALLFAMRDGLVYCNVHTTAFPAGEVRGQMLPDD
jgi:hypothetical protein